MKWLLIGYLIWCQIVVLEEECHPEGMTSLEVAEPALHFPLSSLLTETEVHGMCRTNAKISVGLRRKRVNPWLNLDLRRRVNPEPVPNGGV